MKQPAIHHSPVLQQLPPTKQQNAGTGNHDITIVTDATVLDYVPQLSIIYSRGLYATACGFLSDPEGWLRIRIIWARVDVIGTTMCSCVRSSSPLWLTVPPVSLMQLMVLTACGLMPVAHWRKLFRSLFQSASMSVTAPIPGSYVNQWQCLRQYICVLLGKNSPIYDLAARCSQIVHFASWTYRGPWSLKQVGVMTRALTLASLGDDVRTKLMSLHAPLESVSDESLSADVDAIAAQSSACSKYLQGLLAVVRGEQYKRVVTIWRFNAFACCPQGQRERYSGLILFRVASLVSRSCKPSCSVALDGDELWLESKKDIQLGEELTITYVPGMEDAHEELKITYMFSCVCIVCRDRPAWPIV